MSGTSEAMNVKMDLYRGKTPAERQRIWNELQRPFNGKFWIGAKDAYVPRETVIHEPTAENLGIQLIDIAYDSGCLPPLEWFAKQHASYSGADLRSRLGLYGLDIDHQTIIDNFTGNYDDNRQILADGGTVVEQIAVLNDSGRRLVLPAGFGFFRFYYPWAAERLWNDGLRAVINNPDFMEMSGKENEDWEYIIAGNNTVGINLAIDPTSFKYHPPNSDPTPLLLTDGPGYRERIDEIMVPYADKPPDPDQHVLWVCKSKSVVSIHSDKINTEVSSGILVRNLEPGKALFVHHSAAVVVPGGFDNKGKKRTDWNIRFEIFCKSEDLPEKVRLEVYRDREQAS